MLVNFYNPATFQQHPRGFVETIDLLICDGMTPMLEEFDQTAGKARAVGSFPRKMSEDLYILVLNS